MANELYSQLDICVLIPCHNNFEGLVSSIQSIVYDHHRFLVLIVDDGSHTALTTNALYQYLAADINIQLIRLYQNEGITSALNKGLDFIYANNPVRFIARLDCGDICSPGRFYQQIAYMEENPDTDLLGTWCYFKDNDTGFAYEYTTPVTHELIERSMYFRNVFVHPTVMWRVSALKNCRYPETYPHAEDYALFYDVLLRRKTAILNDFLVTCEINKHGISFANRYAQLKSRLRIVKDYGRNKILATAGVLKMVMLMVIPYRFIYTVKKKMYRPGVTK